MTSALAALLLVALAAAAPTTKFVVSKRYGYSIVLPGSSSDWSANFASSTWSSDAIPSHNDLRLDTLADLRRGGFYLIAARRPPAGKTLEKWTAFVVSARPSECPLRGPKQLLKSTLDGTPALVVTWSCPEGYWVIVTTALHAGRGYFMLLASPTNLSHASDQRRFDAARRSFRFLRG